MEGFRQLMLRAILTKHFDSLEGLAKLVDQARGDVAVLLLRPMCEELIWLQYSLSISKEDSGILLFHMGRVSTYETFSAQKKYAESKDMGDLGFPHRVETTLTKSATDSKVEIEQLGRKLKWRIRGSQLLPTAKFIAKEVGRLEMYELLYHATSRVVHFSVPELMRRVWSRPGEMTVSSEFYEKYWADFALYWGGWIYAQTFAMIAPELNSLSAEVEDYDLTTFEHSIKLLLSEGGMPILTVQEIAWPFIDARARSEQS